MNLRTLFQNHLAQTSPSPVALDIVRASGSYLYDRDGKAYLDLIGGISVCNTGHCHPRVVAAIKYQADQYLHTMVYGELIQSPQVAYAYLLTQHLPPALNSVYFTNSGAEAVEGAIKLSRRVTGRTKIISCINSYHGSTTGALALIGDEYWRNAFRPLMPGVMHLPFRSDELIESVNEDVACIIIETVQAEAGIVVPDKAWMQKLRSKCLDTGTLLVLDEIQCGIGRTGRVWAFEDFEIVPDILLSGKALGGGMPLGAFISSRKHMLTLSENPVLGHITTFGGHPVSCAAGKAAFEVLLEEDLVKKVSQKEKLFLDLLHHAKIKAVRSKGLLIAMELENADVVLKLIGKLLECGVFTDWFLFAPQCIRIAPPLTISEEEIKKACSLLTTCLDEI